MFSEFATSDACLHGATGALQWRQCSSADVTLVARVP
jgi:hypothetical protein